MESIKNIKRPEIKPGTEVKITSGRWKGNHGVVTRRVDNVGSDIAIVKLLVREESFSVIHGLTTEVDPVNERQLLTKEEKQYLGLVVGLDQENPVNALKQVRQEWIGYLAETKSGVESDKIVYILKKFDEEINDRESAASLGMSHYDFVCLQTTKRLAGFKQVT